MGPFCVGPLFPKCPATDFKKAWLKPLLLLGYTWLSPPDNSTHITDVGRTSRHVRKMPTPERTSDFNAVQSIYVHGLAIRGVVCPDHDNESNPKTLFIGANRPAS